MIAFVFNLLSKLNFVFDNYLSFAVRLILPFKLSKCSKFFVLPWIRAKSGLSYRYNSGEVIRTVLWCFINAFSHL